VIQGKVSLEMKETGGVAPFTRSDPPVNYIPEGLDVNLG
jgi:hypothetical protein